MSIWGQAGGHFFSGFPEGCLGIMSSLKVHLEGRCSWGTNKVDVAVVILGLVFDCGSGSFASVIWMVDTVCFREV